MFVYRRITSIFLLFTALALISCKSEVDTKTSLSGTVMAGATSGATVTIYDQNNQAIKSGMTDSDGSFSIEINKDYRSEPLIFKAAGGSYTDEATGQIVILGDDEGLSAVISANTLSGSFGTVNLTPQSTIMQQAVENWSSVNPSVTALNDRIAAARSAF